MTARRNYWSVMTGHTTKSGLYADSIGEQYGYTSRVGNFRNIAVGDVLIIRVGREVLGTGIIDRIDAWEAMLTRHTCPSCRLSPPMDPRSTKSPRYRCQKCKFEFDTPVDVTEPGTRYEARYGSTWAEFAIPPRYEELVAAFAKGRSSSAIDRLDPARAEDLLRRYGTMTQLSDLFDTIAPGQPIRGGHIAQTTRVRRGQKTFRDALIKRFGESCAITGPCPAAALEAAHLVSFARTGHHDVAEGLLLRADLHRLLDAGLLAIDTARWTVVLAPMLREHAGLGALHGASLTVPDPLRPNPEPLRDHLRVCEERW